MTAIFIQIVVVDRLRFKDDKPQHILLGRQTARSTSMKGLYYERMGSDHMDHHARRHVSDDGKVPDGTGMPRSWECGARVPQKRTPHGSRSLPSSLRLLAEVRTTVGRLSANTRRVQSARQGAKMMPLQITPMLFMGALAFAIGLPVTYVLRAMLGVSNLAADILPALGVYFVIFFFHASPLPRERDKWHRWFAWYPIWTDEHELVWLQTVWRTWPWWSRLDNEGGHPYFQKVQPLDEDPPEYRKDDRQQNPSSTRILLEPAPWRD